MAQTADRLLIRKNVRLAKDVHLIFDKERDFYRVTVWRPKKESEDFPLVDNVLYQSMTRAGMIPKKPREYWARFAGTGRDLKGLIKAALNYSKVTADLDELFHYIKSTEWGDEL